MAKKEQTEVKTVGQEPEVVQVDKAYLNKRLSDLVNANQEIFNEFFYLQRLLAPIPPQEVKE